MKIGLLSDVHATPAPLQEALEIFVLEKVDTILCAGDIAGYGPDLEQTVQLLIEYKCLPIVGNHDIWHLNNSAPDSEGDAERYLRSLPTTVELCVEEKKLYMVHANPPDSILGGIKLLDEKGVLIKEQKALWTESLQGFSADLLVVGHTHQLFAEWLGDVLVVNPGSTVFNHTCMILHLPEMRVDIVPLSGKEPLLSWNWGMIAAPQNFNL
jgi:putative phosphoesterase